MNGKFWELLANSTVFQGLITLAVLGIWGYMLVAGAEVPGTLDAIVGTVVGFFFGGKFVQAAAAAKKG